MGAPVRSNMLNMPKSGPEYEAMIILTQSTEGDVWTVPPYRFWTDRSVGPSVGCVAGQQNGPNVPASVPVHTVY